MTNLNDDLFNIHSIILMKNIVINDSHCLHCFAKCTFQALDMPDTRTSCKNGDMNAAGTQCNSIDRTKVKYAVCWFLNSMIVLLNIVISINSAKKVNNPRRCISNFTYTLSIKTRKNKIHQYKSTHFIDKNPLTCTPQNSLLLYGTCIEEHITTSAPYILSNLYG